MIVHTRSYPSINVLDKLSVIAIKPIINFRPDQFNPEIHWKRHILLYRKMAHAEWNGRGSCQYLMSSFVHQAKDQKIK